MNIDLIAKLKPANEFFEAFREGDQFAVFVGSPLVFSSLANTDLEARYKVSGFLLDKGAPADGIGKEGNSALHVLFAQTKHDLTNDVDLARRLIQGGADVNALDVRNRLAFQWVLNMKYSDEDLKPIYDLWFEQPVLDFTTQSDWGLSPIDYARKMDTRTAIAERMENYVEQHNA